MKYSSLLSFVILFLFTSSFTVFGAPKAKKEKQKIEKTNKLPKVTVRKVAYKKKGMSDFKLFEGKEAEPQEISAFSLEGENPLPSGPLLVEKSFFIGILFPDETIHLEFSHSNYPGEMNFNTLEGDPEFFVVSNSCIRASGSCSVGIIFQTSTEGFRFAFATSSIIENETNTFNFRTSWSAIVLEPIEEPEDEKKVCGSILSVDGKSVAERVSVVGAPFDLYYSSAHSEEYDSNYENPFLLNTFNPESWSLSILHSYNALEKNLFPGSGGRVPREASTDAAGNLLVVNGDEVYTFDAGGKHLSTRSALTGRLIYTFSYTADNKIQKITDAFGKETVFTRNAEGGLQSIIAPFGQITTIELDDLGRIISITDPQGQTHSISYHADADLIASFTKPSGMRSDFSFENGYLVSDVANGGNSWTLVPGAEGTAHKTELISKLNRKTVFVKDNDYDTGLYTRTETSPAGFVTSYTEASDRSFTRSNQFESIRQSTVPDERFGASRQRPSVLEETVDGVTRLTQYLQSVVLSNPSDPFSYTQMTSTTKVNDAVSVTVFDKPTMTSTTTNPSGVVTEMKMDEFERPISLKLGNDTALSMSYDSAGRIQQMNQGGSNSVSYTYNAEGYLASETNALNQVTRYNYDAAGRVIQTILADGRILGFEYNPDGRIIGVIPAGRPVHNFSFNLMGLMQTYEPPLLPGVASTQTSYTYNEDKQLTSIMRPDGKSINFSYNATSGLLEARDNQSYSYFPNTELVQSITSEDGVVSSFTYFGTETLKSEKQSFENVSSEVAYSFDNFFRPQQKVTKFNDQVVNTVNTTYRADGAPVQIGAMSMSYDPASGRLVESTLGVVKDFRTYDSFGNLQSYRAERSGEVVYSYELVRDALQRIVRKSETIQGETNVFVYEYDATGRLISVIRNAVIIGSYQYDSNGNWIAGRVNGVPFLATYDDQDRLLSFTNPEETFSTQALSDSRIALSSTTETSRRRGFGRCNNPSHRGPRFNGNNGRSQDGCIPGEDDGGVAGGTEGGTEGGSEGGTEGGTEGGSIGGTVGGTEGGTDGGIVGGTDGGAADGGTAGGGFGGYAYNENGELASISGAGGVTQFNRDILGQLKEVTLPNAQVVGYALDWDGRRVARKLNGINVSRHTFESPLRVAMETDEAGIQKHYIYGSGVNSPDYMILNGENFRIVKDNLGSPRLVISANTGTIVQRMDFNEWGEVLFDSNPGFQGFGFAGGLYDQDTKLVKFGARDYSPAVGRWLSKDPIGFAGGDPNLYGYTFQDPINYIDFDGNIAFPLIIPIIPVLTNTALWGGLIVSGATLIDALIDAYSKGGNQNVKDTGLQDLTDAELQQKLKTATGKEKLRYIKELKGRKLRNKKKREGC